MAVFAPAAGGNVNHRTGHGHPWLIALGVIVLAVIGLGVLGNAQTPTPVACKGVSCPVPPPHNQPLTKPDVYTSSQYGFSVEYSNADASPSSTDSSSISWEGTLSDGSDVSWTLQGTTPRGRSAQQIVQDVQQNNFADASQVYVLPDAQLGYTPGYGVVYDFDSAPGGGAAVHDRLIIIVAVKHNVAVIMAAMGPYQRTTPGTDGHPNPAETPLVDLGPFTESLETVTWPGDQRP